MQEGRWCGAAATLNRGPDLSGDGAAPEKMPRQHSGTIGGVKTNNSLRVPTPQQQTCSAMPVRFAQAIDSESRIFLRLQPGPMMRLWDDGGGAR